MWMNLKNIIWVVKALHKKSMHSGLLITWNSRKDKSNYVCLRPEVSRELSGKGHNLPG